MSTYSDSVLAHYAECPAATVARLGRALEAADAALPAAGKTAAAKAGPDHPIHQGAKAAEDAVDERRAGFQLQADGAAGDVDERLALAAQDIAEQRGCNLAKASSLALAEDDALRADYEAAHVHNVGTTADPTPVDPARAALAERIAAELTTTTNREDT